MKKKPIPDSEFIKSINRFQLLSLATKEGIWEYDFSTKESFYNDGITELFGHGYPELADNDTWWRNNIHPQDKHRIINALDELLDGTKTVWWGKYHFRCKDGTYKLILDRLFVVRNAENKPIRLIGTMQDLTELNTLEEEFINIRKEHQQIMHKAVFQAEEKERHYISEELHENINQVLAAINLHITHATNHVNDTGRAWLKEAQHLLLESISGIRVLSKRLSPVSLDLLGFKVVLEELLSTLTVTGKIGYQLLINERDFTKVSIDLQTVFYRIAQHQVMNILKHSSASHVRLEILAKGDKIKMSIYDNGMGINLRNLRYGKGFSTIHERTEAFGGTFNLESSEGKEGFKMEVII
ncbi:MAG: PAS domain-containing protein [Ferruginibacter sp.]